MKKWAQQACNPHFTPRLESTKGAALKAKRMSQRVRGEVQQCRLCNVGSTKWQNDWAITYLLKAHFIGLCPAEIKCVCVCVSSWTLSNPQCRLMFSPLWMSEDNSPVFKRPLRETQICACAHSSADRLHSPSTQCKVCVCLCIEGLNVT